MFIYNQTGKKRIKKVNRFLLKAPNGNQNTTINNLLVFIELSWRRQYPLDILNVSEVEYVSVLLFRFIPNFNMKKIVKNHFFGWFKNFIDIFQQPRKLFVIIKNVRYKFISYSYQCTLYTFKMHFSNKMKLLQTKLRTLHPHFE